ncbi:hypothetical protein COOONC_06312, partial [Cooperia oncophora]
MGIPLCQLSCELPRLVEKAAAMNRVTDALGCTSARVLPLFELKDSENQWLKSRLLSLQDAQQGPSPQEVKECDTARVWSDDDRRDILLNHLTGSAQAHIKNLPEEGRRLSFQEVVEELRRAKDTPCERLKAESEWKTLKRHDGECGQHGHSHRECSQQNKPSSSRSSQKKDSARSKRGFPSSGSQQRPKHSSLSTHLKSWCRGVRKSVPTRTEAYGEPCYCDIEVFGLNTKALIDTGSVISIIPVGLLQLAQKSGADIDTMATILGDADKDEVLDASGNPMTFLKRIAVDIKVKGAKKANVQLHVQQASDTLILLGTNAMEALGIGVSLTPETDTEGDHEVQQTKSKQVKSALARVRKRVVIPPHTSAFVELEGKNRKPEQVFWSNDNKIASGVCRISHGHGIIPVVNKGEEPWVIPKGKVLGEWSNDLWYNPNTAEIPGDVLEKATEVPEKGKASE